MRRMGFFLFVLVFAGSVVLMAAHDLRRRTVFKEKGNSTEANDLMNALSGNPLSKVGSPEVIEAETIPQRAPGQYLVEKDKKTFRNAISGIMPQSSTSEEK